MSKTVAPQPNEGLAKIGNSFANLFRRQHAHSEAITLLNERLDLLQQRIDALMTQLIAAADEDTDE
jgi:hypothetical protein